MYLFLACQVDFPNRDNLLECERPIYSFNGEDEHQKVVHIKHDDKWIVERLNPLSGFL
jgi:hypothetical protein